MSLKNVIGLTVWKIVHSQCVFITKLIETDGGNIFILKNSGTEIYLCGI